MCFVCREWSDVRDFVSACPVCNVPRGTTKAAAVAHNVMPDIEGYQSQVTGEWIGSRSKHREHLCDHGMIEIGNEVKYLMDFGKPAGGEFHNCPDNELLHMQPKNPDPKRLKEIREEVIKACYKTGYWK
jgi:hypothetical protein